MKPDNTKRRKRLRIFLFSFLGVFFLSFFGYAYFRTLYLLNGVRDARLYAAGFRSYMWQSDSAEINYQRGGSGKKNVVLLHGFGLGGASTWLDPMISLKEDVHLIVPDMMWFGNSQGKVSPSLYNQARVMWQLLDHLDIRPDMIVGISYGGFVGFEMLNQRPAGTDEFLIINSPGPVFGRDDVDSLCLRADVNSPEELFVPDSVAGLRHLFRFVFSAEPPIPEFLYRQIFEFETRKHAEVKIALMRELVANEAKYKASRLSSTVKNKVIWSADDQVFPLRYGRQLADTLGAEFAILPNSGHVPNPAVHDEFRRLMKKMMIP